MSKKANKDQDAVRKEVLKYLFEGYISSHGTSVFDISEITAKYNRNAHEVGKLLIMQNVISKPEFRGTSFWAAISPGGISEVNPKWWNDRFEKVISTLGITGNDWMSLTEILDINADDIQIGIDIAKVLEGTGHIEGEFRDKTPFVRLVERGLNYYWANEAKFLGGKNKESEKLNS